MPLHIVRNDITTMKVDAIVNAANESLLGGGGVDGAIHHAAGPELLAECRTLGGCKTGQAKVTHGYRLLAKFVIHTVGPIWRGGSYGERELLVSAYRSSLELALANGCETVVFPLISSGVYGYPKDQALKVAVDTIGEFLLSHDMTVYLVIFDRAAYTIGGKLFADIAAYIDDHYVDDHTDSREIQRRRMAMASMPMEEEEEWDSLPYSLTLSDLNEALHKLDESFSQMLLRKIDEAGMTDAQCYKKANIDRKLFSKIRSDVHYKPSKPTAMAFAIALKLPLEEAREMLEKAGFAFSHASKFDIIVEYFIAHRNYNIFEINEALFAFDQSLLGG
ncbi:O-acetyl-ADP-ribose deacetylase [Flavonifractor plautii]|uniref:O-acetyl-ADP-ribose deacetylase n=1 Tax=Flavonifractor plautii TaxID=292800 RepID=UPI00210DF9D5|nr:O-acetyl-ADP-ribose deacetylase [Flavonifractor plautii]MCQ5309279.1 O-acetyl-ADP-ribose deacetylase [Flavonifractor plautii]